MNSQSKQILELMISGCECIIDEGFYLKKIDSILSSGQEPVGYIVIDIVGGSRVVMKSTFPDIKDYKTMEHFDREDDSLTVQNLYTRPAPDSKGTIRIAKADETKCGICERDVTGELAYYLHVGDNCCGNPAPSTVDDVVEELKEIRRLTCKIRSNKRITCESLSKIYEIVNKRLEQK